MRGGALPPSFETWSFDEVCDWIVDNPTGDHTSVFFAAKRKFGKSPENMRRLVECLNEPERVKARRREEEARRRKEEEGRRRDEQAAQRRREWREEREQAHAERRMESLENTRRMIAQHEREMERLAQPPRTHIPVYTPDSYEIIPTAEEIRRQQRSAQYKAEEDARRARLEAEYKQEQDERIARTLQAQKELYERFRAADAEKARRDASNPNGGKKSKKTRKQKH